MNSAAQPSILVDDSDAYYYPLLAYARVGDTIQLHSHPYIMQLPTVLYFEISPRPKSCLNSNLIL